LTNRTNERIILARLFYGSKEAGVMISNQIVKVEETAPTIGDVLDVIDETWSRLKTVLSRMELAVNAGPDAGGWDARHTLSHLVGAWQRVPIHSGFILTGESHVPIQLHDPYWIEEWETAPLEAFVLAMRTAVESNKAFVQSLDPAALSLSAETPFGPMTLGELLVTSYESHIGDFHIPQLEAFLSHRAVR
jgi:hypothetical protein